MDFLKKNWVKLVFAAVLLVGAILSFIAFINCMSYKGTDMVKALDKANKGVVSKNLFTHLAITLALLGVLAVVVLKVIGKAEKIVPFILIAVGVIVLILLIVAISNGSEALKQAKDGLKAMKDMGMKDTDTYKATKYGYNSNVFGMIINIIVFACTPIVFGLKYLFSKKAEA